MKGLEWIRRGLSRVFDFSQWSDKRLWTGHGGFGGGKPAAGVEVNESIALTYSAIWAATRIMCLGGCLPLHLHDNTEIEVDGVFREGNRREKKHPLARLLSKTGEARPGMPMGNFRRLMWADQVNWGNGLARKVLNDEDGQVDSLWRLEPWRVTPTWGDDGFVWRYSVPGRAPEDLKPEQVFHVPNIHTVDGVVGVGTITAAREAISAGLATEKYGANFFGGDGIPRIVVESPGKMFADDTSKKAFREEWRDIHSDPTGSRVATLQMGAKANAISIPPEDSQFLGTREFGVEEIARFYGIFPHLLQRMIGTTMNNVEQLPIDLVKFTLAQYFDIWEGAINTQLLPEDDRDQYSAKHNLNGLLRGDSAAQIAFIEQAIDAGVMTRNEGRGLLDLSPVPGGDIFLVQGATVPLDDKGYPVSEFAGNSAAAPAQTASEDDAVDERPAVEDEQVLATDRLKTAVSTLLSDALKRMATKEANAAERAANKPGEFLSWLDEFYDKHEEQLAEAIAAPLSVHGADAPAVASAWCQQSREQLLEVSGQASAADLPARISAAVQTWKTDRLESTIKELVA